jgi:hypothetical protein
MSMNRNNSAEAPLIPNETTIQAMKDARAGRVSGRFATVAELMAELNADDEHDRQADAARPKATHGIK